MIKAKNFPFSQLLYCTGHGDIENVTAHIGKGRNSGCEYWVSSQGRHTLAGWVTMSQTNLEGSGVPVK